MTTPVGVSATSHFNAGSQRENHTPYIYACQINLINFLRYKKKHTWKLDQKNDQILAVFRLFFYRKTDFFVFIFAFLGINFYSIFLFIFCGVSISKSVFLDILDIKKPISRTGINNCFSDLFFVLSLVSIIRINTSTIFLEVHFVFLDDL